MDKESTMAVFYILSIIAAICFGLGVGIMYSYGLGFISVGITLLFIIPTGMLVNQNIDRFLK